MKVFLIVSTLIVALLHSGADARNIGNKIIGGQTVPEGVAPYQAALLRTDNLSFICGGCIINSRWVLTVDHCLIIDDMSISVGSYDLDRPVMIIKASKKISHPYNDIALLQVEEEFPFQNTIQPINLPTANLQDGASLRLTGWGAIEYENGQATYTRVLKMLDTFSVPQESCVRVYPEVLYSRDMCTFKDEGQGACFGDSGSPYVANGEVHAVTSRVVPCAVGYPDVNTRVFSHVSWIQSEIQKND